MIDILLINPFPSDAVGINDTTVEPPIGLGYLGAVIEREGLSVKILDANILHMLNNEVVKVVQEIKPSIVGITANIITYRVTLDLTKLIKEEMPECVIMLGGAFPTTYPLKTLTASGADAVVFGEGEETIAIIIDRYKKNLPLFDDVHGVAYMKDNNPVKNASRNFIKDIDSIPLPAYHLYPDLKLYKSRSMKTPIAPLLTSRGCPYLCTFCSQDVFQRVPRLRTPDKVIEEIDMLVREFGVKQLDILDDNFTMNKKRTEAILDRIIERDYGLAINLQSGVRIEGIDQNIIDKMKKAGVYKMAFGVESGDPEILKRLKKNLELQRVFDVYAMAKKAGITVNAFFMLGLPGDTPESMQKTIDFAIKMNPNVANFSITIPFPGTELYNEVKERGKFLVDLEDGLSQGFYSNQIFFELDGSSPQDILHYYKRAYRKFYFRPSKIVELLINISSWTELKWFASTSVSMLSSIFKKS